MPPRRSAGKPKRHYHGDGCAIRFVQRFRHWRTGKMIVAPPGHPFPIHLRKTA